MAIQFNQERMRFEDTDSGKEFIMPDKRPQGELNEDDDDDDEAEVAPYLPLPSGGKPILPIMGTIPTKVTKPTQKQVVVSTQPLDVLKLAKARIKELKVEMKRMRALEKELVELTRLVDATKPPRAVAIVRDIKKNFK